MVSGGGLSGGSAGGVPGEVVCLFVGDAFNAASMTLEEALQRVKACTDPSTSFKISLFPGLHVLRVSATVDMCCALEMTNALTTDWDIRNTLVSVPDRAEHLTLKGPQLKLHHLCFDGDVRVQECSSVTVEHCIFFGPSLRVSRCCHALFRGTQVRNLQVDNNPSSSDDVLLPTTNINNCVLTGPSTLLAGVHAQLQACVVQELCTSVANLHVERCHFGYAAAAAAAKVILRAGFDAAPAECGDGAVVHVLACGSGKFLANVVDGGGTRQGLRAAHRLQVALNTVTNCTCGLVIERGFEGSIEHNAVRDNLLGLRISAATKAVVELNLIEANGFGAGGGGGGGGGGGFGSNLRVPRVSVALVDDMASFVGGSEGCGLMIESPNDDDDENNDDDDEAADAASVAGASVVVSGNIVARNKTGIVVAFGTQCGTTKVRDRRSATCR
jgi:hypothetical protein